MANGKNSSLRHFLPHEALCGTSLVRVVTFNAYKPLVMVESCSGRAIVGKNLGNTKNPFLPCMATCIVDSTMVDHLTNFVNCRDSVPSSKTAPLNSNSRGQPLEKRLTFGPESIDHHHHRRSPFDTCKCIK